MIQQLVSVTLNTLNKQHSLVISCLTSFTHTHTMSIITTATVKHPLFLFPSLLCQLQSLLSCYTSHGPYKSPEAHKHVITQSHTPSQCYCGVFALYLHVRQRLFHTFLQNKITKTKLKWISFQQEESHSLTSISPGGNWQLKPASYSHSLTCSQWELPCTTGFLY